MSSTNAKKKKMSEMPPIRYLYKYKNKTTLK